jgi:hypothetical protein
MFEDINNGTTMHDAKLEAMKQADVLACGKFLYNRLFRLYSKMHKEYENIDNQECQHFLEEMFDEFRGVMAKRGIIPPEEVKETE